MKWNVWVISLTLYDVAIIIVDQTFGQVSLGIGPIWLALTVNVASFVINNLIITANYGRSTTIDHQLVISDSYTIDHLVIRIISHLPGCVGRIISKLLRCVASIISKLLRYISSIISKLLPRCVARIISQLSRCVANFTFLYQIGH